MAEAVTERVRRYILDGTDQDLRRLLSIAELSAEMARSAFGRLGVRQGWNAIDCGCGPIGGLAVMAEMVGPAGRVVGIDFSRGWPAECAVAPLHRQWRFAWSPQHIGIRPAAQSPGLR